MESEDLALPDWTPIGWSKNWPELGVVGWVDESEVELVVKLKGKEMIVRPGGEKKMELVDRVTGKIFSDDKIQEIFGIPNQNKFERQLLLVRLGEVRSKFQESVDWTLGRQMAGYKAKVEQEVAAKVKQRLGLGGDVCELRYSLIWSRNVHFPNAEVWSPWVVDLLGRWGNWEFRMVSEGDATKIEQVWFSNDKMNAEMAENRVREIKGDIERDKGLTSRRLLYGALGIGVQVSEESLWKGLRKEMGKDALKLLEGIQQDVNEVRKTNYKKRTELVTAEVAEWITRQISGVGREL